MIKHYCLNCGHELNAHVYDASRDEEFCYGDDDMGCMCDRLDLGVAKNDSDRR